MTGQERELILNYIESISTSADGTVSATYHEEAMLDVFSGDSLFAAVG